MVYTFVRTIISRCVLLLTMLILAIPVGVLLMLPERWRYESAYARWCKRFFYWAVLKGSFLPIEFVGKELMPNQPAIIVANHQSSLDIPLVGSLVAGEPHVWLATNDLMSSPILRWILPRATVLIDVSDPMRGMRSLVRAIAMIHKKNRHAIIFPEGGRFADGKIHNFYGGFVVLAKKTGRPVVPVFISGAHKVYPRGSFLVQYHPIRVVVGPPMWCEVHETDEIFKERVRQWFIQQSGE